MREHKLEIDTGILEILIIHSVKRENYRDLSEQIVTYLSKIVN
jgi:hypothetical protein